MKKPLLLIVLSLIAIVFAGHAYARTALTSENPAGNNCKTQETTQINVSFNDQSTNPKEAKNMMDAKVAEIQAIAKEIGIEEVQMQSFNYNLYMNSSDGCGGGSNSSKFQFNGNVSLTIPNADKAPDLTALLAEKGFSPNLNVSSYNNCENWQ